MELTVKKGDCENCPFLLENGSNPTCKHPSFTERSIKVDRNEDWAGIYALNCPSENISVKFKQ